MSEQHKHEAISAKDVHAALADLRTDVQDLRAEVKGVRAEVAGLKMKSRLWGAVTGALTAIGLRYLP